MNHFANKILKSIGHILNIEKGSPSIICCSAGPDSVFLAHIINKLNQANHHLIYFDHQLRPKETKNEITIVKNLGKKLKNNVHIIKLNCDAHNQEHYRKKRLKALQTFAETQHCYDIYLGHHLNDHIETFLMQTLKGGTTELNGIQTKTVIGSLRLYHPLLSITKTEILSWLKKESITYSTDSSNLELNYTRNKIRPLLADLMAIQNTTPSQINESIQYIQTLQNRNEKLRLIQHQIQRIEDQTLLSKQWLKSQAFPEFLLKIYIESTTNEYINKDRLRILKNGLEKTTHTELNLENHLIDIDYKWIRIKKAKQSKPLQIKTTLNSIIKTEIGSFCITVYDQEMNSTNDRLALSKNHLKDLKIEPISVSDQALTKQKKVLRNAEISPIQQEYWPTFILDNSILWIPTAYNNNQSGNTVITFKSKLNVNFEK